MKTIAITCPTCATVNQRRTYAPHHFSFYCIFCCDLIKACNACGKTSFDNASCCKDPGTFSPAVGDWVCGIQLSTETVDNSL